jgi:Holliday junction resolvase
MTRYHLGRRGEWKVKQMLQKEGYYVVRAAASKGVADLVAIKNGQAFFVQVKRNCKPTQKELNRLYDEASSCGAFPVVAIWNSKKRRVAFYHVEWEDEHACLRPISE